MTEINNGYRNSVTLWFSHGSHYDILYPLRTKPLFAFAQGMFFLVHILFVFAHRTSTYVRAYSCTHGSYYYILSLRCESNRSSLLRGVCLLIMFYSYLHTLHIVRAFSCTHRFWFSHGSHYYILFAQGMICLLMFYSLQKQPYTYARMHIHAHNVQMSTSVIFIVGYPITYNMIFCFMWFAFFQSSSTGSLSAA